MPTGLVDDYCGPFKQTSTTNKERGLAVLLFDEGGAGSALLTFHEAVGKTLVGEVRARLDPR